MFVCYCYLESSFTPALLAKHDIVCRGLIYIDTKHLKNTYIKNINLSSLEYETLLHHILLHLPYI